MCSDNAEDSHPDGSGCLASAAAALDPLASSEKKGRKSAIAIGRQGTVAGRRIEGVDDVGEWVISRGVRKRENISSGKERRGREGRGSVLGACSQEVSRSIAGVNTRGILNYRIV